MLTAVATEQAAGSETSCSSGDGGGDLRRGAAKARSVAELRGKRALGARLARRSGRRQSCRTQWNGARSTVATVTPVRCLRRRRPWWGKGEGEATGENGGVQRLGGASKGSSNASTGEGGKQVAPWRARARRRHLPACSGESRQLTGAGQHSAGPPGGLPGKFSAFCSFLFFYLFLFCVLK